MDDDLAPIKEAFQASISGRSVEWVAFSRALDDFDRVNRDRGRYNPDFQPTVESFAKAVTAVLKRRCDASPGEVVTLLPFISECVHRGAVQFDSPQNVDPSQVGYFDTGTLHAPPGFLISTARMRVGRCANSSMRCR